MAYLVQPGQWTPADHGYLSWAFDPLHMTATGINNGAGYLILVGVRIPYPTTVTNVHLFIHTAGASLTTNQCYAGLYQGGNLLASTASQHGNWNSTGLKTMALSTPQSVSAGLAYVGFVWNGGTDLRFGGAPATANSYGSNLGLSSPTFRFAYINTAGQTSMPASFSTQANYNYGCNWAAVS